MNVEIDSISKALVDIDMVSMGLGDLRKQYGGVIFEVSTFAGLEKARAARQILRAPRYEVERIRKEAKKPILDIGRKLDSEAARITKALLEIEGPIDEQIKTEESRKERERVAKIEAEQRRVSTLQERVTELRGNRSLSASSGAALIAEHIEDMEKISVDASFEEFQQQAEDTKAAGLAWLRDLHGAAVAHEAEQVRIRTEREELARLRKAEDERQASERARIAQEERAARLAREAETARQAEEFRKQREANETEARAAREKLAEEQRQVAAERREFERQQQEARQAREAEERERAEQARIASVKRPDDLELVAVLAKHYRVPDTKVREWLAATNWKKAKAA
jgi:colicin import membrane protein